jgi:CDP-Glycerol:Poly(glycerophosphate) glycerophosphotransferase
MSFFSEYKQVNKLLQHKKQVVFYAESKHDCRYFEKLICDLLKKNADICYITSDANDPVAMQYPGKIKVIYVRWLLGFLFSKIRADVMIMTMPDLGNYLFKRSPLVGTYIYIFHAAVSTHQQYSRAAFFNYDAVFCAGEYQEKEIRRSEELYKQKQKNIVRYGYPLLDDIKSKAGIGIVTAAKKPTILIAPSWFQGCIFDICIEELLLQLSKLPYNIILRSHPEYEKRRKKNFRVIQKLVSEYRDMSIDSTTNLLDRLATTDVLITDRSGIALEFAFGAGRPVLFIETSLKQTNPDWRELNIEPLENKLRSEIGVSVLLSELDKISEKINELQRMNEGFTDKMSQLKKGIFYNSETSYREGLDFVMSKLIYH